MPDLSVSTVRLVRFGPLELNVRAGSYASTGFGLKLREQPFQILILLLEHPGEVLREEIRLRLWPNNTVVEFDHGIKAAIQKLRDALGESAGQPLYVETVARRGYRFIGQVENVRQIENIREPDLAPPAPMRPRRRLWAAGVALGFVGALARCGWPALPRLP